MDYLITWRTYGTWLPGDDRGWVSRKREVPMASEGDARARLVHEPFEMDRGQREVVELAIRDHCGVRAWRLHALNVRSNHVHLVVFADRPPERVMGECKAWASRRLRAARACPERIWARHGSTRYLNDEAGLSRAIEYVRYEQ